MEFDELSQCFWVAVVAMDCVLFAIKYAVKNALIGRSAVCFCERLRDVYIFALNSDCVWQDFLGILKARNCPRGFYF